MLKIKADKKENQKMMRSVRERRGRKNGDKWMLKLKADKKENQKKMRSVRERRWRKNEDKRMLKIKVGKKENQIISEIKQNTNQRTED
jgi:hypothetical protein